MTAADPFVDCFAPQMYWHNFPDKKMLKDEKVPGKDSPLNDPEWLAWTFLEKGRQIAVQKANRL